MPIPDATPEESWVPTPSSVGLKPCIRCDSPTQSHAICVREADDGMMELSNPHDSDFIYPVCHTCFVDVEGHGDAIVFEMNASRSPLLLEAGITPKMLDEYTDTSQLDDSERYRAVGDAPVRDAIPDLVPGDVIQVNDEYETVIIPIAEDVLEDLHWDIECSFISVDAESYSGAIITEDGEYRLAYVGPDGDEIEVESIETIEYLGFNKQVATNE